MNNNKQYEPSEPKSNIPRRVRNYLLLPLIFAGGTFTFGFIDASGKFAEGKLESKVREELRQEYYGYVQPIINLSVNSAKHLNDRGYNPVNVLYNLFND